MNIKANRGEKSFETHATRLFEKLQHAIVCGKLPPGTRLVRRDLCRKFKVSQATISEALWRLEAEGLAESVPMYGTRVIPLTLERVENEVILREALECQVARLLAERHVKLDRPKLMKLAAEVERLRREVHGYGLKGMQAHQEFHVLLARLTGSDLLRREVERIWQRHLAFFSWHSAQVKPPPKRWHQRLLDAIFTGDPDAAEEAMRAHVRFGSAQKLDVLRHIESSAPKRA